MAEIIMAQELKTGSIEDIAKPFINPEKEVNTVEDALNGAMDIIAEDISDNPHIRSIVRDVFMKQGMIVSKKKKDEDSVYRMYYDFSEPVAKIAGHRVLAINRGEKEEFLQVKIEVPEETLMEQLKAKLVKRPPSITSEYVEKALADFMSALFFLRLRGK